MALLRHLPADPVLVAASAPVDPDAACVSCGRATDTPFCPWCGERRPDARRHTLKAFFEETLPALVDFDGRLVRSMRVLFDRPGELTVRYMRGERANWIPPLRVFLVMNVVFFLAAGVFHVKSLDTPLKVQLEQQWYSRWIAPLVVRRLAARQLSMDQYAASFDALTAAQARTLVILMVPMFAGLLALVNARRRRPALHHLAHAFHSMAALLGIAVTVWAAIYLAAVVLYFGFSYQLRGGDGPVSAIMVVAIGAYFAASQERAYGDSRAAAIAKGLLLALLYGAVILQLYRPVLFFVTFWTT